jgi:hypothetical protein
MHPKMHPLEDVPAAVVDDLAHVLGVKSAGKVRVDVMVVVQAPAVKEERSKNLLNFV